MSVVNREDIIIEEYREILDVETHHNHIIIDENGVYRWKKNERVRDLVTKLGLNDLVEMLHCMGYDKNSEVYRRMYRDMGYSLYGYWETFYWEVNNPKSNDYIDKMKSINRDEKISSILK